MTQLTFDATDLDSAVTENNVEHSNSRDSSGLRLGQEDDHLVTPDDFFYRFYAGSGSTVNDVTGNGFDGSISGATWASAPSPRFAGALSFDGTDDTVSISTNAFGSGEPNLLSAEVWFYPTTSGRQGILSFRRHFTLEWDDLTSDGLSMRLFGDNTGSFGPTGLSKNTWHHALVYKDNGNSQAGMWVNGGSENTYSFNDDLDSAGEFDVGANVTDGYYFDGKIAEVRTRTGSKIFPASSLYATSGNLVTGRKQS